LKIDQPWPSSAVLANGFLGKTMVTSLLPTALDQSIRIQTTDGSAVGYFKYQPISGSQGPFIMAINGNTFTNFLVSPTGTKQTPVNATDTENERAIPNAFSINASFPIPAIDHHVFKLGIPNSGTVIEEWIDPLGRRMLSQRFQVNEANTNFEMRTDVSSLSSGMYLVRIRFQGVAGDRIIHRPVIVVR